MKRSANCEFGEAKFRGRGVNLQFGSLETGVTQRVKLKGPLMDFTQTIIMIISAGDVSHQPLKVILGFKYITNVQLCICSHHKNINLIILILLHVLI